MECRGELGWGTTKRKGARALGPAPSTPLVHSVSFFAAMPALPRRETKLIATASPRSGIGSPIRLQLAHGRLSAGLEALLVSHTLRQQSVIVFEQPAPGTYTSADDGAELGPRTARSQTALLMLNASRGARVEADRSVYRLSEEASGAVRPRVASATADAAAFAAKRSEMLALVRDIVARLTGGAAASDDAPLMTVGLDSESVADLIGSLRAATGLAGLSETILFSAPTGVLLADHLARCSRPRE